MPPPSTGGRSSGAELLLFTGFLGSGKTTLIMGLARELAARGLKTAFIVNEVGEIGVDQKVMRDGGLEVIEITAGCICCQIGIDLVTTLQGLDQVHGPRVIIVEASGVATPGGVTEALAYYRGRPFAAVRSIGVLDPTRLDALLEVMTPLIESQIRGVDEIVVTKTDECAPGELERAREAVWGLNPGARLYEVAAVEEESLRSLARALLDRREPETGSAGAAREDPGGGGRPESR